MGSKVYIEAGDDTVLGKLRRDNLDDEVTALEFDYPTSSISRDLSDAKEDELINKLCEGLELLKTNTRICDLSIEDYLRDDKEKEDATRVERAYVKLGEYLAANESIKSLDFHIDYLSDAACSAVAQGIRSNHSVNDLRLHYHARDVTSQGIDMLAKGIRDNNTIRNLHIPWKLVSALSHNDTIEIAYIDDGYGLSSAGEKALAEALRDNNTLREVTIDVGYSWNSQFGREAGEVLAEAIAGNSSLRKLSITGSKFGGEAVTALAHILAGNNSVTQLSIRGKIGDKGAVVLAEALKTNRTIMWLDLEGNEIGDEGIRAIVEALKANSTITSVNLKGNKIGDDGFRAMAEVLKVKLTVTRLDTWLGIRMRDFSREGARAILEAIKESNGLEELDLPSLKPDDEDARKIAEILRKNDSLTVLSVSDGTFGDEEGVAIANALRDHENLKTLDIHGNHNLGIEGAKALAEALQVNSSLQTLNIASCWGIKDEGAEAILGALRDNKSLRRLKMFNCKIEDKGARALAGALHVNTSLNQLDIGYSDIGIDSVKVLAEAIKSNTTLKYIDLQGCLGGDEGGIAIGEALRINTSLSSIYLCNNKLRDKGIIAIAQGLESNHTVRALDISSYHSYNDEDANHMGISGIRALRKMLETNKSLAILDIQHSFNPASWEVSHLVSELAAGLKDNQTLAELHIAFDHGETKTFSASNQREFVKVLLASNSKNILGIWPHVDGIGEITGDNRTVAEALLEKILEHPEELTIPDIKESEKRLSAVFSCLNRRFRFSHEYAKVEEFSEILETLEKREKQIKRETALQLRRETNDRVISDVRNHAEDNGLTFEQMSSEIALYQADNLYRENAEAFTRLVNGDYNLRDIDTLLEISNDKNRRPAMIALRQFVNHSLIPHLDYFLIQALKTEDVSQVNSGDYPNIARLGGQPVLEAGITGFHEEVSADYGKEIAIRVEEETEDINLSFLRDRGDGTIGERFNLAYAMVGEQTQKFEEIFAGTRIKIIEIITQRDEAGKESHNKEQELIAAKKTNADIQERIGVIVREIEEKDRIATARNDSREGWAWVLGGLQITAASIIFNPVLAITGISTIISGYMQIDADKQAASTEAANLNSRIDSLASRKISESSLERQIKQLKQAIEELTKSEVYQKKYGSAQKMEAVRKAYLAKYMLDFGQQNIEEVYDLCKGNGVSSMDEWIEQFDWRLRTALTNFCFGYADSNDLSIILAEANSIPAGDNDLARTVLRDLAEEYIKRSIAEHYSHAAQVDKIYQANLIGLGTNLHEARAMVRRETDRVLAALIGYQHSTEPALIEGQYSARGASDVSRVFAYWQHKHGDRVLDTSRLLYEYEPSKFPLKKVTALPEGEQQLFIERVKRTYAAGNTTAPEIGDDFLRVCAYEYISPKFPHDIASGRRILSDNPQALAMYPVINATINNFIRALSMNSLDHYRQQVGEKLDNLIAQTFIDFFAELGTQHIRLQKVVDVGDELENAKTRPELFARIFEKYTRIVGKEANSRFDLFLEIYASNLEKMLEVTRSDDRNALLEQIDSVHELTQGKLKPDITMPGSEAAKTKARNDNHTYENTHWKSADRG